jgi:subtilisin family serine protease
MLDLCRGHWYLSDLGIGLTFVTNHHLNLSKKMYKVKYGGKKGKTVELEESPDLVAVRTKDNMEMGDMNLSRASQEMLADTVQVVKFPDSGITIIKMADEPQATASRGGGDEEPGRKGLAGPPDTTKRDATRAALKQEDDIRFAGRVLQDKETGEVTLYTENFFVKFFDATKEEDCLAIIEKYKLTIKDKLAFAKNAYFVCAAEGTGLAVFNIAETILNEKIVEYCHPELVQERRFKGIHPLQWHLTKTSINGKAVDAHVNIEAAWQLTKGKGTTIAIIDDGVDVDHPEFAGRIVHPFDSTFKEGTGRPVANDDNHGTACAGMACASGLKDGASGTAPESFLMPIRLRSGLGSMSEANAFAWAAQHGADVISCSWGPTDGDWWDPSHPLHNKQTLLPDSTRMAMEFAMKEGRGGKGCVILFAAGNGNEATANDGYVSHPGVIAVSACNDTGKRSVYSDFGEQVWVAFPSGDFAWKPLKHPAPLSQGLRTTDRAAAAGYDGTNYTNSFGGTSGACPGMAGVVALMLAANPALTPPQVKEIIRNSCDIIDTEGGEYDANKHSVYYGYGRINAEKAVQNAKGISNAPPKAKTPIVAGNIRFGTQDMPFSTEGQTSPSTNTTPRNLTGIALQITPAQKNLRLVYQVNVGGKAIQSNAKPGDFVGGTTAKTKLLGIAFALEGSEAKKYDIEYAVKFEKETEEVKGKNGSFCGVIGKTGKAIQAINVVLKAK